MKIPFEQLDAGTLQSIIEEYVSREGTDYGQISENCDMACKVSQVLKQLKTGRAYIVFDSASETCDILTGEQLVTRKRSS